MTEDKADVEEQRRLAKDWAPDIDGPLVGSLHKTTEFTRDFPESDSRFPKIRNLTAEFPFYRSMKRDGSCGYRALLYGYLLNLCKPDADGFEATIARLDDAGSRFDSMQSLLKPRGWEPFIYEDWLEACLSVCKDLAATTRRYGSKPDDAAAEAEILLTGRMNDEEASVELLQYMRAVTSSYILKNGDDFAPFVIGADGATDIKMWCEANVDPPSAEMDEQSLLAFYRAVIEPAGMSLYVHYLERSAGDRLMVSEYTPSVESKKQLPAIHLLYRPGHYDLLLES